MKIAMPSLNSWIVQLAATVVFKFKFLFQCYISYADAAMLMRRCQRLPAITTAGKNNHHLIDSRCGKLWDGHTVVIPPTAWRHFVLIAAISVGTPHLTRDV